jgi:hypothetical protein
VKIELRETGAAQLQTIPPRQIVLMKFLEGRLRAMHCDAVEIVPVQIADPAVLSKPRTELRTGKVAAKETRGSDRAQAGAMVTRSLRAFEQVMRATPVNSIWTSDASAASRKITSCCPKLASASAPTSDVSSEVKKASRRL